MLHDLAAALRSLRRHPSASLTAILTLALGLGLSATIFTVVDSVLLRPFPFEDQDRIVSLWSNKPSADLARIEVLWDDLVRFRDDAGVFEDVAAISAANNGFLVRRGDEPVHLQANFVSEPLYRMTKLTPFRGRLFNTEDHKPGTKPVAVLSYNAWTTKFGADESILDTPLTIDGEAIEVIGVLPPHFDLPRDAEMIFPLEAVITDPNALNARILQGIAKLSEDTTLDEARAALESMAVSLQESEPETHEGFGVVVTPLVDEILGATKPALRILLAMGVIVLCIAWANVAGLMLTRSIARAREFALRSAIGARGIDLFRQLLAEAIVIAIAASAIGLGFAWLAIGALVDLAPASLPRLAEIGVQPSTFAFLAAASLVVSMGCAVVTVFRASAGANSALAHDSGTRATMGRPQRRLLTATAVVQIALALALVLVSSLFVRAFLSLDRLDVGFSRDHVVTLHLPLGYTFGQAAEARRAFFNELFTRVDALPDVEASGSVLMRPLEMEQGWDFEYTVDGQDDAQQKSNPSGNLLAATPRYFDAMGIRLLAGRGFTGADRPDTTKVALVSESFAARHGGTQAMIGKRVKSGNVTSEKAWIEVVGVVADVRYRALGIRKPDIYVPFTQTNWSPNYVAIKTHGNPEAVLGGVRRIVNELDPSLAIANVRTTKQLVGAKLAQPRLNAAVVTLFAVTAVALALVGLYSVVSYDWRSRTTELGIRSALGASRGALLRMIFHDTSRIAILGLLLGVGIGLGSRTVLASMLPDTEPMSLGLIAATSAAMLAVALAASLPPATKAAGVDPVKALRHD